jgi:hypothetical protein
MQNVIKKVTGVNKKKIIGLLITLVCFVILDGLLTQYLVPSGAATEANSFLAPMVGKSSFMIIKIVGSLICALILYDVYRRYPKAGLIATWVAVIGYGIIVLWNTGLILLV